MKFFSAAIFLLFGGLIAFSSHATIIVNEFSYTPAQCAARPPVLNTGIFNYWTGSDGNIYAYYDGCEYKVYGVGISFPSTGYIGNWYPTGRVKPSSTGSGTGGTAGTGGAGSGSGTGNGSGSGSTGGTGGGSGGSGSSGSSGSAPSVGGGSGGTGWDSVGFPDTGGTGWGSGGTSGTGGSGSGSGSSSGSSSDSEIIINYGINSQPGIKPGETVTTFNQPLPAPVPYGEPTSQEIKNYAKDFFIYNKECGNSCLDYFDTNQPPYTPLVCLDSIPLHIPHKKPDCRSNELAWFAGDGTFIEFKYRLTDKARHDIINKLKGDFSSGGSAPFYSGVSKLPLPVEVTNTSPNYFNTPSYFTSERFKNFKRPPFLMSDFDSSGYESSNYYNGVTPFELLSVIDNRLKNIHDLNEFMSQAQNNLILNGDNSIISSIDSFHNDFNSRLSTDNLDTVATDSVSKLSSDLMGLLNGQNVGGQFSEASALMAQIGNGSDSPLLGKFLDSKLIPIVDTRRCEMPVFGRGTEWEFTLNSVYLYKLKQILTFIMYALTFWYLFDMLTNVGGRD